ncbi:PilZ domain-containing protein [bacterium]|nr:PilZ domain-containing protein [candidate division CSSED10-310 bacterium]
MASQNHQDRRRSERFQTLNLLSFHETDSQGQTLSQGIAKTLDLSETGALIQIPHQVIHPENFHIEIALEEEIIKVNVDVVDQVQKETGEWQLRVKFLNLKPVIRHRLTSFIRSLQ